MTCHDAREQFSALVDEALGADARPALDAHLVGCAECRRELEAFRRTVALVRGIEPARAPAGFVDRVLAATRPDPWPRRLARRLFLPWPVKVPLEAAAVIIVGVLAVWLFQRMPEQQQMARTEAPSAMTSRQEPAPHAPPASPPRLPSPPPAAKAPADKRESNDAPGVAPHGEEVRAPIAREGLRDQASAAGPRDQGLSESPQVADAKMRKEAPAPAEGKPAQVQSTARERDKDAAAGRMQGLAPPVPPSQVAGRLSAPDRERAERELQALVAKHGGTTVWRRGDGSVTLVDMEIPRDKYAQFVAEVTRLGRFTIEREVPTLPETVRIQVQLE